MTTKSVLAKSVMTILGVTLFCGSAMLAQAPVQDIEPNVHPNLAAAQSLMVQAYNKIEAARQDNDFDMSGHAKKAESLLYQASVELKTAAGIANKNRK